MYRSRLWLVLSLAALVYAAPLSGFCQDPPEFPVGFDAEPAIPVEGEIVIFEGTVTLPHPGFELMETQHDWDAVTEVLTLTLVIQVDRLGLYPPVEQEVLFRHRLIAPISFRNPIREHILIRRVIPDDPLVEIESLPDFVKETLSVDLFPMPSVSGQPLRAAIRGEFPSSGYRVLRKSVAVVDNIIRINMTAVPPEVGLTVLTPFTEHVQVNPLKAGRYTLQLVINGEIMLEQVVTIEENTGEENNDPPHRSNPFDARFGVPAVVSTGELLPVGLEGNFPTSGWELGRVAVETSGEITRIEVEAIPPEGPAATVVTPFRERIAALELPAGLHFLRGTINGDVIPAVRFFVGEVPVRENLVDMVIRLRRTGGFAGDNSWIELDSQGHFELLNRFQNPSETRTGRLDESTFNGLINRLESSNFEDFPSRIEPSVTVADAFQYSVVFRDTGIVIEFLEDAPAELQEIVRSIEAILNNPAQTSDVAPQQWMIYR